MAMTELQALIRLNASTGLGPKSIRELAQKFGSASRVFEADEAEISGSVRSGARALEAIKTCPGPDFAEEQIKRAQETGARIIPFNSPDYPEPLKNFSDSPVLLHVLGNILQADYSAVGMVGTRHPTPYGGRAAEAVGRALARQHITVVSGMALGIDAIAHRTALEENGRTIAVLGCGVDQVYPKENLDLYHAIIRQGAVVSEFPFGTEPLSGHFPRRNRIISSLSRALCVIEAGEKSGALITAHFALDQGKDIFAVPGGIYSPQSSGTNRLIQQGAHPLLSPEELLECLGRAPSSPPKSAPAPEPEIELSGPEKKVMAMLSGRPAHIDEIVRGADLPLPHLHPVLLSLQLKGCARELAGMQYVRSRA
jgi:DNA processing protein